MSVESASTITGASGFNLTLPTDNDPLAEGSQHIRLVKQVLATTFPNITGPVLASQNDFNTAAGSGAGTTTIPASSTANIGGAAVLKGQGTDPDVMLRNESGSAVIRCGGAQVMSVSPSGVGFAETLNAVSLQQGGNTLIPYGVIVMWAGAVAAVPAGWHLCDGTSGTPDLRDRFIVGAGLTYSPGASGGATSATPTTATGGAHSHGGATASGGAAVLSGVTDTQGSHSHGGSDQPHSLTIAELPPHSHHSAGQALDNSNGGGADAGFGGSFTSGPYEVFVAPNTGSTGLGNAHSHVIAADGSHAHNVTISSVPAHTHGIPADAGHTHTVTVSTMPPFYALAFIMKL